MESKEHVLFRRNYIERRLYAHEPVTEEGGRMA